MFAQLKPLLKQRVVTITVSDIGDDLLRVNIIPRKADKDSDENAALTTPLSVTGKAEELDRDLAGQITSFTESVLKTGSNLEQICAEHAAAVRAVESENRKKLDDRRKGNGSKGPDTTSPKTAPSPEFKDGKPVFGTRSTTVSTKSQSLFDAGTNRSADELGEAPKSNGSAALAPDETN
jgi:PRTRC genetic system protein E